MRFVEANVETIYNILDEVLYLFEVSNSCLFDTTTAINNKDQIKVLGTFFLATFTTADYTRIAASTTFTSSRNFLGVRDI